MFIFDHEVLKKRRAKKNLTLSATAERVTKVSGASMSHMTVKRTEEGIVDPRIGTLLAICSALELNPKKLLKKVENGSDD